MGAEGLHDHHVIHEMGVRPGGARWFVVHGQDGVDHPNEIVYLEVVRPERLVDDHGPSPRFRVTVTFTGQGGGTRLTAGMRFESAAQRDGAADAFVALRGLDQTLDRLGERPAGRWGRRPATAAHGGRRVARPEMPGFDLGAQATPARRRAGHFRAGRGRRRSRPW